MPDRFAVAAHSLIEWGDGPVPSSGAQLDAGPGSEDTWRGSELIVRDGKRAE